MKRLLFFVPLLLIFSSSLSAQNVLQEKIKNSVAFRQAAEKLKLEPGSVHVITTTFIIDNTGILEDVTAQSEYPELEIIALDILNSLLPEQAPKHKSTQKQKITLPMQFHVETEKHKQQRLSREKRRKGLKN